jgi:transposase
MSNKSKLILENIEANNIFEISKEKICFIQLKNQISHFISRINKKLLIPDLNHANILKNEIKEIKILSDKNSKDKDIAIKQEFYERIINLKEMDKENTIYAKRIKEIFDEYIGEKKITLKYIQIKYNSKYNQNISLITISRILRYHLNIRFKKTILKTPKLTGENYIIMTFCFLYGIINAMEKNLKLIYIDETGFDINNNHLYLWRKHEDIIYGGPTNNNLKRINAIMAMDKNEIILSHYYIGESIGTNEFIIFLNDLIEKIGKDDIRNYLVILDNATYNTSKKVKLLIKKKGLKLLFNIPYKSEFNAIEIAFHLIKNNLYNEIISNQSKFIKRINYYINSELINKNISKAYLKTFESYIKFFEENLPKINQLSFMSKKRRRVRERKK